MTKPQLKQIILEVIKENIKFTAKDAKALADKHNDLNETNEPDRFDVKSARKSAADANSAFMNSLKERAIGYIKMEAKKGDYTAEIPASNLTGNIDMFKYKTIITSYLEELGYRVKYDRQAECIKISWE